mgnify:CR=1 FL=1
MRRKLFAVVTGAQGGIGRAIVHRLLSDGFFIIAIDQTDRGIFSGNKNVINLSCDISDEYSVRTTFSTISEKYDWLDVLVNLAGINHKSSIANMEISKWDHLFSTNVGGMFLTVKYALQMMKARKNASIINFSSIAGHVASKDYPAYVTSKAAVESFTIGLSKEVSKYGIRANAVAPGWVNAGFTDAARLQSNNPKELEEAARKAHLMGRMAEADEIASVISWLANPKSNFITGQIVFVDGGLMRVH